MTTVKVEVDLRNGRDDLLELIAPCEPQPLYNAMSQQGFENSAEQTPDGDWKVTFFRNPQT